METTFAAKLIMIQTDILIIGAGPCGLFTVFEAGLLKLKCHLIDALPQAGGQCAEIYPKKPIFDIPAYPEILAGDLVDQLMAQAAPFKPGFTLGERAETIIKDEEGQFVVTTNRGTVHRAPIIAIAGGLGCFEPRKPPVDRLEEYEDHGVEYIIKDPREFVDIVDRSRHCRADRRDHECGTGRIEFLPKVVVLETSEFVRIDLDQIEAENPRRLL